MAPATAHGWLRYKLCSRFTDKHTQHLQPVEVLGDFNSTSETAQNLVDQTIGAYNQLDILVNNAGLFKPIDFKSPLAYDTYTQLMRVNLDTTVKLTHLAVPHLIKSKGCVVNISSNLAGKTFTGGFAYCTAKAALSMFTKSIAVDLAPDVRVNSISPGPIATLMSTRSGMDTQTYRDVVGGACLTNRVGEPEEVARLVVFLASPESAFITGSDFIIDGGSTIKP